MASEIKSTDPHLVPESTTKAKEESKPTPFAKPTTRESDDDKTGGDQALSTMSAQPPAKVAIDEKWLHPLAEFKVEKMKGEFDGFSEVYSSTPVLWKGDVYLTHHFARSSPPKCELLQYSISNGSWNTINIPCKKVHKISDEVFNIHQLSTYSNLLLVTAGDKVLEFDSCNSTFRNYSLTIPPSSGYGDEILAMTNQGDYLLLLCKSSLSLQAKSKPSVKLFDGNVWMIREGPYLQHPSKWTSTTNFQAVIHNSTIIILERLRKYHISIHKKSLRSLIDNKSDIWQIVDSSLPMSSNLVIQNNNLLIASVKSEGYGQYIIQVLCYSSKYEKAWLELGCTTVPHSYPRRYVIYHPGCVMVAIPDGSLLMMITAPYPDQSELKSYTLKPEVQEYDPEKALSARAVMKLELGANIPISRNIQSPLKLLSKRIMLAHPDGIETMMNFILGWIKRWEHFEDCLMPSWSNFYMVLREVSPQLGEIADQIEAYLNQYLAIQAKRSPSDQTYLASKLMVRLSSLCSESAVKERVKSGLDHCIEMCDDLSKQDLMKDETDDLSKLRAELTTLVSSTDEVEAVRARLKQCVEICDGILQRMRQLFVKKHTEEKLFTTSEELFAHVIRPVRRNTKKEKKKKREKKTMSIDAFVTPSITSKPELPSLSYPYASPVSELVQRPQPSDVPKSAGTRSVAFKPTTGTTVRSSIYFSEVPTQLPLTGSSGIMPHEKLSLKRPSSARGESADTEEKLFSTSQEPFAHVIKPVKISKESPKLRHPPLSSAREFEQEDFFVTIPHPSLSLPREFEQGTKKFRGRKKKLIDPFATPSITSKPEPSTILPVPAKRTVSFSSKIMSHEKSGSSHHHESELPHQPPIVQKHASTLGTRTVPPQLLLRGSSEIMPHETSGLKRASTWGTSADSPKRLKYSFESELSGLQHKHSDLQRIGLSGVDVHGTTSVVISNSSLEWCWEEFGLKVHVHNDSLPPDIKECRISINVSLSGHYEFPEDESLVSAVFWFRCDPLCKLAKPVTVEIQHCAPSDNVSSLSFVKAVCTQKELPYTFKHLTRGSFCKHSSFGIIELTSFSGLGITQKGSKERDYLTTLLYREDRFDSGLCFHLYFVITWNTAAHYKVMKRFFDKTKMYTNQLVVFESDRVEFRLSTTPGENWTVMSINSYVVEKKVIDNFTPGKTPWIPYSQFKANLSGVTTENVPPFHCTVHLHGAKEPQNQLTIDINPSPVGHGHGTQHARHQDRIAPYSARAKPTLKDLMRELRCKAAFWEDIGVELQIDDGVLAQIQRDKNGNSIDCLREMIRKWLVQVSPTPSWSAIVEAVETIGDEELAKSIKTRFC